MKLLSSARFFTTVAKPTQLPQLGLPELAFVGRSNAGKSSAINTLCSQKRLAFSSKTPGRTQALNFFGLGQKKPEDPPTSLLVDTPGYGYAEVAKDAQKEWAQLSGTYLGNRPPLAGVVLVMDIRRGVTDKDRQLIDFCPANIPILALLSKADKFGKQQQIKQLQLFKAQVSEFAPSRAVEYVLFSMLAKQGLDDAGKWIYSRLYGGPSSSSSSSLEAQE